MATKKTATKKATPKKKSTKKVEEAKLAPEATPYVAHLHDAPVVETKTSILDKIKKFFGL
jgi:hypothetical protein